MHYCRNGESILLGPIYLRQVYFQAAVTAFRSHPLRSSFPTGAADPSQRSPLSLPFESVVLLGALEHERAISLASRRGKKMTLPISQLARALQMTRDGSSLPRLTVRPLHHQYEARLRKTGSDENTIPDRFRHRSPSSSDPLPHKNLKRSKHIYSDRFIPSRLATKLHTDFDIDPEPWRDDANNQVTHDTTQATTQSARMANGSSSRSAASKDPRCKSASNSLAESHYSMLLKSELLGVDPPGRMLPRNFFVSADESDFLDPFSPPTARAMMSGAAAFNFSGGGLARSRSALSSLGSQNFLRFKAPRQGLHSECKLSIPFSGFGSVSTTKYLGSGSGTSHSRRKFPKAPFKVLDAPSLQDDFYLNLVDWSASNVLAVGLGSSVYLWSACTSRVTKLCDLGSSDLVTSVCWSQRGSHLSVGTNSGEVQVWDVAAAKKVRTMGGHVARVGTLAWSSQLLASGSRDRTIYLRDVRAAESSSHRLTGHKQEVCGLKWSFDDGQLASGGNDNKLLVWSVHAASSHASVPVVRFSDHTAAVKAIAWSPHQSGLLASGGGTADRCIRFWNTQTQTALQAVDTGSQVCNLMWSKNANELVSTHGYSLNQIIVWKCPSMTKLATMTGHTFRVLYLAMSPDGETIVTGAGDETLRFWNAFPSASGKSGGARGPMLRGALGLEIR